MTTTKAVETSVTSTNSFHQQDYTNLDSQLPQTCYDSPRFKPFTLRSTSQGSSQHDDPCALIFTMKILCLAVKSFGRCYNFVTRFFCLHLNHIFIMIQSKLITYSFSLSIHILTINHQYLTAEGEEISFL